MSTESKTASSSLDSNLFYVTYVMDTQEQATSLSEYLILHGVDSIVSSSTEVQVPLTNPVRVIHVYQLRQNWRDYWANHVSALFDLPIYVKKW